MEYNLTLEEYAEKCELLEHQLLEMTKILRELYSFSRSVSTSGERMWCECDSCNKLKESIETILRRHERV